MKKHLYILLVIYLSCLLFSCGGGSSDEPQPVVPGEPISPSWPQPEPQRIGFNPSESAISRSSSPLEDSYKLFKVWAYKNTPTATSSQTPSVQTVMPGYQVKFLNSLSRWQYDGTSYQNHPELADQFLKYWDASASSYDFYAIAPAQMPDGVTVSLDPNTGLSITGIPTHSETHFDCIVAKETRYFGDTSSVTGIRDVDALVNKDNEPQPSVFYDPVPLMFHHLLAKVEYRIYNTGSKTALIDNIIVNYYDKDDKMLTSGEFVNGQWENLGSPSNTLMSMAYITQPLEVPPSTKDEAQSIITYYEIPQSLKRYINVSVEVEGEIISPPEPFDMGQSKWEFDKYYIYYIHLQVEEGDNSPILIDLSVDDFLPGDPIDDEQTNW